MENFSYLCNIKMRERLYRSKQHAVTLSEKGRIDHGDKISININHLLFT